jgi:hypothetical protein
MLVHIPSGYIIRKYEMQLKNVSSSNKTQFGTHDINTVMPENWKEVETSA